MLHTDTDAHGAREEREGASSQSSSPPPHKAATTRSPVATNAHLKGEIRAAEARLKDVAQHFSVEWKKFLAYAMAIKQASAASAGDDGHRHERSELEDLLLQSHSGLVMLREMQHEREHKWRDIAERYGYREPTKSSPSARSGAQQPVERLTSATEAAMSDSDEEDASLAVTARLIAHHHERARVSRLFLARTRLRLESAMHRRQSREQSQALHRAATAMLAHALQTQHRLEHAVSTAASRGASDSSGEATTTACTTAHVLQLLEPEDVDAFVRFTNARTRAALPLERLLTRMQWLCTSHRFHVRQRMLALFHEQRTKNAPVSAETMLERIRNLNSVTVFTAPAAGLVHCPLFVLSPIQLDAELTRLTQRHLAHALVRKQSGSGASATGGGSWNIVTLKVQVEQLFEHSMKATAIALELPTSGGAEDSDAVENDSDAGDADASSESERVRKRLLACALGASEPFFANVCVTSHWDIQQLDVFECSTSRASVGRENGARSDSAAAVSLAPHALLDEDDALLRSEWELLRLDDREYTRIRVEALARNHFERARIDLSAKPSSGSGNNYASTPPLSSDSVAPASLLGTTDANDDLLSADALYALYLLRIVSCRAKRHRLLRLLNYFHYLALSRRGVSDTSDASLETGAANGDKGAKHRKARRTSVSANSAASPVASASSGNETLASQHPASYLRVEKRQNDVVIMERHRHDRRGSFRAGGAAAVAGDSAESEVILPGARQDLAILERHMLRTASVFVRKQERASLPSVQAVPGASSSASSSTTDVLAIDRMQVMCDVYDCELRFMQAKLEFVQLLLASGLELCEDALDDSDDGSDVSGDWTKHTHVVRSVLTRRPRVDFSHAYFYESYAAETLQLELQMRLHQQVYEYVATCERDGIGASVPHLEHQMIRVELFARLYAQQRALVQEAEQQWFCVQSVGECHALHQALLEQLLITWRFIVSVELASAPAQCLERSGDAVLASTGWQLVFPSKLVADCCRNVQQQRQQLTHTALGASSSDSRDSLVALTLQALALVEWHRTLGQLVYEASVLERVYAFQYDFVSHVDAGDSAARASYFFFDDAASASSSDAPLLVPIAHELLGDQAFATLTTTNAVGGTVKTVPEWFEAQLALSGPRQSDAHWRSTFLTIQRHWTRFLASAVRYQDLLASEIVEFAACSPFLFLESASERHRDNVSTASATGDRHGRSSMSSTPQAAPERSSVNAKAVHGKYADEIAEKMTDEMAQHCYPYWIALPRLKEQLQKRFASASASLFSADLPAAVTRRSSGDTDATPATAPMNDAEADATARMNMLALRAARRFGAVVQYLDAETAVPAHLVRVNHLLLRLRNERALMATQSAHVFGACAFTPHRVSEELESGKKSSTLTQWLSAKLAQLQHDLHTGGAAAKRSDVLSDSTLHRHTATTIVSTGGTSPQTDATDDNQLLLALPSQLYLIDQFAVPLCREHPTAALAQAAALASAERAETLRLVQAILEALHTGLDLSRVTSSIHVALKRLKRSSAHAASSSSSRSQNRSSGHQRGHTSALAHGLLERWQTQCHEDVRAFHDRILDALPSHIATSNIYARTADKVKVANRSPHDALAAIRACLEQRTMELAAKLQCMASFLLLQTVGTTSVFAPGRDDSSGDATDQTRESLLHQRRRLRRCLLGLAARLRDATERGMSSTGAARSASELLQVVYRTIGTTSMTGTEREVCALWDALETTESDGALTQSLTHWLELQRVFVCEHMRPAIAAQVSTSTARKDGVLLATVSQPELEVAALSALDTLWDRYELIVPEHEYADVDVEQVSSATDALALARPPSPDRGDSTRSLRRLGGSFAQRRGLTPSNRVGAVGASRLVGSMCLPPVRKLAHQCEFLRLSFALQWVQSDIHAMERHYEAFLDEKKRSQARVRSETSSNSREIAMSHEQEHGRGSGAAPALLALRRFFRPSAVTTSTATDSTTAAESVETPSFDRPATADVFVVPASELALVLQDLAATCAQQHKRETRAFNEHTMHLQHELSDAHAAVARLETQLAHDAHHDRIEREAYAFDYAYSLHFRIAQRDKALDAMARRMALERLDLECALSDAYDAKLAAMHAQLVATHERFDAYRVAMQHDLHVQLQGAQTQLVHDLVDHSGAVSVEMKANLLANLHGQHAQDDVRQENVALKQTLLKLQALLMMQQQAQHASAEREQLVHQRHKTTVLTLRHDLAALEQHVAQLESDVGRLSHEKTSYMLKWSSLQKDTERAAQLKREAKIRALSAPFHREAAAYTSPFPRGALADLAQEEATPSPRGDSVGETLSAGLRGSSPSRERRLHAATASGAAGAWRRRRAPEDSDDDEAFERYHEVAIRRPAPASGAVRSHPMRDPDDAIDDRSAQHAHNSMRHYQQEIKRLAAQLAKETKANASLRTQVTHLKALATDNNQSDAIQDICEGPTKVVRPHTSVGRVLVSPASSPRTPRAQSASVGPIARPSPPATAASSNSAIVLSKRPSTSSSLRTAVSVLHRAPAPGSAAPSPRPSTGLPPTGSSAGSATPTRRFEVQKRSDDRVRGIAGTTTPLSAREPLPYR